MSEQDEQRMRELADEMIAILKPYKAEWDKTHEAWEASESPLYDFTGHLCSEIMEAVVDFTIYGDRFACSLCGE